MGLRGKTATYSAQWRANDANRAGPGLTNVLRFPVELRARPTLALLREMAPDVREVLAIAEAFGLDVPVPDLRARVDVATAEHIVDHFPGSDAMRPGALNGLLDPVLQMAVAACRAAHDAFVEAARAQENLLGARTAGHVWLELLRERTESLTLRAAGLLIEAHARVEAAEGVARAVDLARRGEPWVQRDHAAEDDALVEITVVRRTG